MRIKTLIEHWKLFWSRKMLSICSAVAFLLLVTSPDRIGLTTTIPFVLALLLANLRYGRKDTWLETIILPKYKFLLLSYGIYICWAFYRIWIFSSKAALIAELLHIPHGLLVLLVAVGLLTASIPFVLQTISMVLHCAGGEEKHDNLVQNEEYCEKKILLTCFFVAAGTMTVCSKSSVLYPMNDWVDANCFYTVGKSMMNGIVPYRDLFEQKGPFLYFLHGLAWMISGDSFLGVYFLEVLAATFFLYYTHKSVRIFVSERTAFLVIPVAAVVIYTSPAFCHGDSVEELFLPFLAHALWIGLRAMQMDLDISDRDYLIIGICSGLVFWSKFILVGFYIGWFVVPAAMLLKTRAYRKLLRDVGLVATGVLISTIPFVIYFGINNAIGDWLEVYLYDNLFLYSTLEGGSSGFLKNIIMGKIKLFCDNRIYYVLCIFGMLWLYLKDKDRPWKSLLSVAFLTYLLSWAGTHFYLFAIIYLYQKKPSKTALYMTSMMFFTFLFTYMGGQYHAYYAFVFSVFVPFGVVAAVDMFRMAIPEVEKLIEGKLVPGLCIVLSIVVSCWLTPNRYMMGMHQMELPQYQFAQIVHQVESPTLLNYGFLDGGFYTAAELFPTCKAFCRLNVPLEEMVQLQEKYIQEGLCDFVVTMEKKLNQENYICVAESSFIFEGKMKTYYLHQLK